MISLYVITYLLILYLGGATQVYVIFTLVLRRKQSVLPMLDATSTVLRRLNIQHWLCSGCLLGAVRDGGKWIKNDDKCDISMTAENFNTLDAKAEEFINLLNEQGKKNGNHYVFQTYPDGCIVQKESESDASMR